MNEAILSDSSSSYLQEEGGTNEEKGSVDVVLTGVS